MTELRGTFLLLSPEKPEVFLNLIRNPYRNEAGSLKTISKELLDRPFRSRFNQMIQNFSHLHTKRWLSDLLSECPFRREE